MRKLLWCLPALIGGFLFFAGPASAMIDDLGTSVSDNPELAEFYQTANIDGREIYIGPKGANHEYLIEENASDRCMQIAYNAWNRLIDDGFGEVFQAIAIPYIEHKGWLYISVWDLAANDPEVWRVKKGEWEEIRPAGYDGNGIGTSAIWEIDDFIYYIVFKAAGGAELWRTNGSTAEQIGADGFGDANNERGRYLGEIDGYTYISFDNDVTGAELWRSRNGRNWVRVNTDGFGNADNYRILGDIVKYDGKLYVGGANNDTGAEVHRSSDGTSWTRVNAPGFGNGNNIWADLYAHRGRLYAVTRNTTDGFEIWRTKNGTNWNSKMTGGFGNANNFDGDVVSTDGRIYVSAYNYIDKAGVWRTKKAKRWNEVAPLSMTNNDIATILSEVNGQVFVSTINAVDGSRIWMRSKKDDDWERYNNNGMNLDNANDAAILLAPRKKYVFTTTENFTTGTQVWRLNFSPGPITTLEVSENSPEKVVLKWKAPGGQDRDHYVIKRYKKPITEQNWWKAKLVDDEKEPRKRKKKQKKTIEMPAKRTYYFAIKTIDNNGIESAISNVPVAIRNLAADNIKKKRATLKWSKDETARYYNVQIRTESGEKLKTWKEVENTRKVTPKGWLEPNTTYKFRVRSVNWDDEKEAWSPYQSFTTNS